MNVYDFDNTIYNGESALDFFLFCLKKDPSLARFLPNMAVSAILYKLNLLSFDSLLKSTARMSQYFIQNRSLLDDAVQEFWKTHHNNLKPWLISQIQPEDIIVTASPDFLFDGVKDYLPNCKTICSRFDLEKGQFSFVCYRENKVHKLQELYPDEAIETIYTDSYNDKALIELAKQAFLVKGDSIRQIKS